MTAEPAVRWQWRRLLTQPHRLGFAAAALLWAAGAGAWALALLVPPVTAGGVPPPTLHALVFTLGPMPLFFAGFLFTSAPTWLRAPPLPATRIAPGVAAFVLAWLLVLAGGPWCAWAAAAGLALAAWGWGAVVHQLLVLRRGATRGSRHFDAITAAAALLLPLLAATALAVAAGRADLAQRLARAALWGAVLPVFLVASHRLLPFLSHADAPQADAAEAPGRARWVVAVPLAGCLLAAVLALAPAELAAATALRALRVAVFGTAALLTGWLVLRWARHPATRQPLMRQLLRALGWSGLGWVALAVAALPGVGGALRSGLDAAAVHALALGFAGGTLLAMVTRVSATQAGHALAADPLTRRLDALLQVALLARVGAALWPPAAATALPLAALLWAVIATTWLWRHGGWAGRPRVPPPGRR